MGSKRQSRRLFPAQGTLGREAALVVFAVLLGAVATSLVIPWIASLDDPQSISRQLETIRSTAAKKGLDIIEEKDVDLRATGEEAHLFVFRNRSLRHPVELTQPALSDEIRLYSDEGGSLRLSFKFRPELSSKGPVLFNVVSISDLDGNGRPEILGSFTPWAVDSLEASPFPLVITWNDADSAYRMYPLVDQPPRFRRQVGPRGLWGRSASSLYRKEITITDRGTGQTLKGFTVLGFSPVSTTPGRRPAILESFVAKAPCHFCDQTVEVQMLTARYQPEPETSWCTPLPLTRRGSVGILVHPPARELVVARPSEYLRINRDRFARRFECL